MRHTATPIEIDDGKGNISISVLREVPSAEEDIFAMIAETSSLVQCARSSIGIL